MRVRKKQKTELVNERIPNVEILVITDEGENLGKMLADKALQMAYDKDLDLVVVAPDAKVMVARMMDYSKFRYEQQRRLREMKRNRVSVQVKEIRLSPTIGEHDFNTRLNHARRFIKNGDKVKISLRFRGRMITHKDLGKEVIDRFIEELGDTIIVEARPKLEGMQMFAVVAPNNN